MATPASSTGIGWSLQAGGMVSRSQRGLADETPGTGYYFNGHDLGDLNQEELTGLTQGSLDGEPDLFSFSFGNYSGKFFFDGNPSRGIIQVPQQDISITCKMDDGKLVGFHMRDPTGTNYYFGFSQSEEGASELATEYQDIINTGSSVNPGKRPSTWYLKEITSADRIHKILFDYRSEVYQYISPAMIQSHSYHYFSELRNEVTCDATGGSTASPTYVTESGERGT